MMKENSPPVKSGKKALYTNPDRKPDVLPVNSDGIPTELKIARRWVLWVLVWKANKDGTGKWDKVPKRPDGRNAKSTDPATWNTLDAVLEAYHTGKFAGVGFVLGDGIAGIDLDDVRNPETGDLVPWAAEVMNSTGGYADVSPSGTGVKLLGRGMWTGGWHKKPHPSGAGEIEVYSTGRYFTLTGHPAGGGVESINIQPALDSVAKLFTSTAKAGRPASTDTNVSDIDEELLAVIRTSKQGDKFARLWSGDKSEYGGDDSAADLALCGILAYWCRGDADRIDRLIRRSGLMRAKWDSRRGASTYGRMTIAKALTGKTGFNAPGGGVKFTSDTVAGIPIPPSAPVWSDPVPLTPAFDPPPFPVDVLPDWMRKYAEAVAEEKQVPVDLPALLILGATAAGIARKVTVSPWPGWAGEPTNLFVLCALPPGERKSQTFAAVFAPVAALEADLRRREEPAVRAAESAQRVAQKRVDLLEGKVAKCDDPAARATLLADLTAARDELAAAVVPALPLLRVDDDTPEMLALELVKQHGRLLAASPEARTLENIDRYADKPNLDVFLKGHAGDDLRSGRVGRGRDEIDRPALTCAYAPQPCVVEALGQTPEMRGRGFLARWFYSLPVSAVGYRKVRGAAVPVAVRTEYDTTLTLTWLIDYANPAAGTPHDLRFAPDAVAEFERFEGWKEEHLRPGGLLHGCGGWGNKLGGLCVRLCGLFHVADGVRAGDGWRTVPVSAAVVRRAVTLCREYAVPHARAAFAQMGDTPAVAGAKAVLRWLAGRDTPTAEFSKRDVFNGCRGRFGTVDDLQPALDLLERHYLIRPKPNPADRRGPGRPASPVFEVNPAAHNPHNAQNDRADAPVGGCANTADCAPGRERPVESSAKGDGR